MQKAMAVAGSVCVGGCLCVSPLPAFVPSKKRGLGSGCGGVCGGVCVSPRTALQASQLLSLFSKLAVKLWLFKVKRVPVKANGCLLYRQVFLKDQNILELICEISFLPCRVK